MVDSFLFDQSPPVASVGTGISNLPSQRHKIVAKNGANFTVMVCGKLNGDPLLYNKHIHKLRNR
jgi:cell division control protein 12